MRWTFWSVRGLGFTLVLLALELNVFTCHCLYAFPNHHHQTSPVESGHHDHAEGGCIHTFTAQQSCELRSSLPETARSLYVGLEVAMAQNANVDPLFAQSPYVPPPLLVVASKKPAIPDIPPKRL